MNKHSRQRIVVLGSTGSIGKQTLAVIKHLNDHGYPCQVVGLAAKSNVSLLAEQARCFSPQFLVLQDYKEISALQRSLPHTCVLTGNEGLCKLARLDEVDIVVNALVGAVGLRPSLAAIEAGKRLALANKESLVIGGALITAALAAYDAQLIPIDSEHHGLFQLCSGNNREEIAKLIITASGGPLRDRSSAELKYVTPIDALTHPNWTMGPRITIDTATMVNKGFEVIEAHYLFDLPYEQIEVVIHPQSIIHSLVEYRDKTLTAQLAVPDMRIPIQYALTHPQRLPSDCQQIDLLKLKRLEFSPINDELYPAFTTVITAGKIGQTAPAVINAADEVLVERFLKQNIPFTGIADGLAKIIKEHHVVKQPTVDDLLAADTWAREAAANLIL
ncbi:1-deoxy-D-xylulose-5-phosphate reductoisomerase [Candidatus Acetothermia bacterium]|nr:1-deoxy-D-xylulose-5-phosphate reductoisomerase [Candidatus Acetothermia bacterium]MCI2427640.1 1-deoxy-D-xylulose-5-phosphate reductoisomerase [Candidatus Acetothermia bacterium]MCI2428605.1 1-deoxy-D-xylulose-5-phosphate reductoisomerase [Candidatus Acetothermia bacterium]